MSIEAVCQARCAANPAQPRNPKTLPRTRTSDKVTRSTASAWNEPTARRMRPPNKPRGRAHPDDRIVAQVLQRVDGVVGDGPGDGAGVEKERRPIEAAEHRGPAHQRAPGESEAEHRLRPKGDAFHQGIDRDHGERSEAEPDAEAVEGREHGGAEQAQQAHEQQGRARAHLSGGQAGARACARPSRRCPDRECRSRSSRRRAWRWRRSGRAGGDRDWARGSRPRWRQERPTTSTAAARASSRSDGRAGQAAHRDAPNRAQIDPASVPGAVSRRRAGAPVALTARSGVS